MQANAVNNVAPFFCIIRSEMIRAGLPSSACRVAGSKMMPLWGKVTASAPFFRS